MGEHPMIPVAPMIANAIEDALSIRMTSMPITAEKLCLEMIKRSI
jgi:carbon-monoxide dehydrogenase large subunit